MVIKAGSNCSTTTIIRRSFRVHFTLKVLYLHKTLPSSLFLDTKTKTSYDAFIIIRFNDNKWSIISLPIRFGGLAIRKLLLSFFPTKYIQSFFFYNFNASKFKKCGYYIWLNECRLDLLFILFSRFTKKSA